MSGVHQEGGGQDIGPHGTRARLLEAATRIIVDRGVGGLRIRQLARAVGIREGSVYNHFSGRSEIIKEVFRRVDAGMAPMGAILDLGTTPPEQLESLRGLIGRQGLAPILMETGEHLIRGLTENPDSLRVMRAVLSERFHDLSARAAYEEVFRPDIRRVLLALCTLAHEAGALRAGVDPSALADLVGAVIERAIEDSLGPDGVERLSATLRNLLGCIGVLSRA